MLHDVICLPFYILVVLFYGMPSPSSYTLDSPLNPSNLSKLIIHLPSLSPFHIFVLFLFLPLRLTKSLPFPSLYISHLSPFTSSPSLLCNPPPPRQPNSFVPPSSFRRFELWAWICKRLRSPGINSKEGYRTGPPGYIGWRNRVFARAHSLLLGKINNSNYIAHGA